MSDSLKRPEIQVFFYDLLIMHIFKHTSIGDFTMSAAIRKSDLQKIIREEYARVLLENSGHRVTEARVRLIAEKIETGELDEAFSDYLKGFASFAGEKIGGAADKVKAGVKAAGKDISRRADAFKSAREEKEAAEKEARLQAAREKLDSAADDLQFDLETEIELAIKNAVGPLRMRAKDRVQKMIGLDSKDMAEDYDDELPFAVKVTNMWDNALGNAAKPDFSKGESIGGAKGPSKQFKQDPRSGFASTG